MTSQPEMVLADQEMSFRSHQREISQISTMINRDFGKKHS